VKAEWNEGFEAWNEPEEQKQEPPPLSTAKNIAEILESPNIISESADTNQDSMPDLSRFNHEEPKSAMPLHHHSMATDKHYPPLSSYRQKNQMEQ
jgi:hypothetical protein